MSERQRSRRVTLPALRAMKERNEPITMVTAYDATFGRLVDEAGADAILVGDSVGMVVGGLDSTLPVTVDEIVYHCRAVARGASRAHLVADMPFMSYQVTPEEALRNAGRMLSEGGAHAVKLEGGTTVAPTIARIVGAGIPVMGHVGLTPQSVHAMGGFRVQGKTEAAARRVVEEARAVAEAGAYALVLEGVPSDLAAEITETLPIPTIGIGAGPECDGQVLVCYDLLGLTPNLKPRFVKRYDEWYERGVSAVAAFREDVRARRFPAAEHGFGRVGGREPHGDGASKTGVPSGAGSGHVRPIREASSAASTAAGTGSGRVPGATGGYGPAA
jgi:3-methyl-2-oxobutanoate hydroxymethyltransferase